MAQIKQYDWWMANNDPAMMRKLYSQWKKVANERIRVINQPKYRGKSWAYQNIVKPLKGAPYMGKNKRGEHVFRALPKDASDKQVRQAFQKLTAFLSNPESTAKGLKARIENDKRMEADMFARENLTEDQKKSIDEFLGSPEGKAALEIYDSEIVVMALSVDFKARPKAGSALERWREWESSGKTLADWVRDNEDRIISKL